MVRIISLLFPLVLSFTTNADQITYTENDTSGPNFQALGYPVPIPVASQTPIDGFRDYASLFARHQDIALSSPLISGQIIGQTIMGDDIWAYVLSDADSVTSEGNILEGSMLQNGGIHAREWQTPEVTTAIIERFSGNQDDQGFYQYLLENAEVIIIPVLNVDGFQQTQKFPATAIVSSDQDDLPNWPRDGRMRRKNMRNVDNELSTEGDTLDGIDLNRNNDPFWATNSNRSSFRSASIVHHGAGPASEPETRALQAAADLANGRLRFYIDTHSFTRVYFAPLTSNTRRNNITANVAAQMRAVNNNSYAYSPSGGNIGIGSTDEYFANTFQIPSYTLETEPGQGGGTEYGGFGVSHDGFVLPESQIARVRNELTNASVLGYYMQAGAPSIVQIQISRTDDNSTVYQGQWQAGSATTRTWQESTNIPLLAEVNYRVRLSFNKTMRWRINDQISQYPGQTINLNPSVILEGFDSSGASYSQTITNTSGQWLNGNGTENNGELIYHDDSYLFEFSLTQDSSALGAQLQQLAISTTDLAGQSLDSDPATVIDWNNGAWSNYESTNGTNADIGGVDRTIRLIDDGSPAFTNPATANDGGGSGGSNGGSGSGSGGSGGSGSGSGSGNNNGAGNSSGGGSNGFLLISGLLLLLGSRLRKNRKETN